MATARRRPGREIMRDEAAAIANCTPDSFSGYVTRGQAPAPVRRVGRTPLWDEDVVTEWAKNRPGHGAPGRPRGTRATGQGSEEARSKGRD